MNLYLANTDKDWFTYLATQGPDEVNFWQPGGSTHFKVLQEGEPFLFRLKSPLNVVAGGGFFVRHVRLPLSIAWDTFRTKNGVSSFPAFHSKILSYRSDRCGEDPNPEIGCLILTQPFFFDKQLWIPQPADWGRSIVQGKSYSIEVGTGAEIWSQVRARLQVQSDQFVETTTEDEATDPNTRYRLGLGRHRLGQGAFRVLVTEAYGRRCAITGERTLPVLEAAHIRPYAEQGPHDVKNGLLLRSDLHTLFDQGYITVTTDYRLEVSARIRLEFENGRDYYAFQGRPIALPRQEREYPLRDYLAWHNNHVYQP